MSGSNTPTTSSSQPRLWNPNAAANWSLLFTPAFGGLIHAANWRALGMPDRAKANMGWVWASSILIIANFCTVFLPAFRNTDAAWRLGFIALLLTWYFNQARQQARYVKEK